MHELTKAMPARAHAAPASQAIEQSIQIYIAS